MSPTNPGNARPAATSMTRKRAIPTKAWRQVQDGLIFPTTGFVQIAAPPRAVLTWSRCNSLVVPAGPITTEASCQKAVRPRRKIEKPRRMGPGVRRDDIKKLASHSSDLPDGQKPVEPPTQKYSASRLTQITFKTIAVSFLWRGVSRSSRTRDGMRWTLMCY